MSDPLYEAQVAEVRRAGWVNAAVVAPFVVVAWLSTHWFYRSVADYLSASLYTPACKTACEAAGGRCVGHRLGGRGNSGKVLCECHGADPRWHDADLSRATTLDTGLHYGGQEVLTGLVFFAVSMPGVALGWRVSQRRRAPGGPARG